MTNIVFACDFSRAGYVNIKCWDLNIKYFFDFHALYTCGSRQHAIKKIDATGVYPAPNPQIGD